MKSLKEFKQSDVLNESLKVEKSINTHARNLITDIDNKIEKTIIKSIRDLVEKTKRSYGIHNATIDDRNQKVKISYEQGDALKITVTTTCHFDVRSGNTDEIAAALKKSGWKIYNVAGYSITATITQRGIGY